LNREWPVCGTTGYDYLNLLNGLFVDRRGTLALRDVYARFTGHIDRFADVLYESKQTILNVSMSSELHVLARQLDRISEQHRYSRDFTRSSLRRALREVIASFPVYRTYIRPAAQGVSDEDRRRVQIAIRRAKRRNPAMSPSFFDFIASVLLLEDPDGLSEEQRQERRQFVLKFQQLTGPVTAKGLEDTSFYRYYPLASLNDVGGDPSVPGVTIDQFHRANQERREHWPYSLLATATHDTKRGEDVRARLNVLSEIPEEWELAIRRWHTYNEPYLGEIDGEPVPHPHEEYLLYQTLVGSWPLDSLDHEGRAAYAQRIEQYMRKALREAKQHTSWLHPDEEYEQRVSDFLRAILGDETQDSFLEDLDLFVRSIAEAGIANSLAQVVLKVSSPGVPDFYQGTELWDFNLVDPDNRRPVDFERRKELLTELESRAQTDLPELIEELVEQWPDERIKLFTVWKALAARRQHPELFLEGRYLPLTAEGPQSDHVCALAREHEGRWLVAVAPRLSLARLRQPVLVGEAEAELGGVALDFGSAEGSRGGGAWRDTALSLPLDAPDHWHNVLTGEELSAKSVGDLELIDLGEALGQFPVAMLMGEE
jgi:(1->4)-alpha-D-glucan 1-alpha-D-glucosylmutase